MQNLVKSVVRPPALWQSSGWLWFMAFLLLDGCLHIQCHGQKQQQQQQQSGPTAKSLGVHIVRAPESAVAPKGDEVVFECELNLAHFDRLDWRFRHADNTRRFNYLRQEDGFNITNGEVTSKLRIYVSLETLGDYQCVAWYGSSAIVSTSAHLTLASISIDNSNGYTRNAIRWSLSPNNCVLIRCGTVYSNPPAIWSFYRNGVKMPQTDMLPGDGALVLNAVTAKNSGNYTCSAMNAITGVEVQLPQRIDVRVDYTDRTPPYFLSQPPSRVTARPGETVVLECPGLGSPPPKTVWSTPFSVLTFDERKKPLTYGLQIANVVASDQALYVCDLDNGIAPSLVHKIELIVLQRPHIVHGPIATLTNEGDPLELECVATGNPMPQIHWLINGEDMEYDNATVHENRRLIIHKVEKRHAGIVQCFAKNEVGEASEGNLLEVNPKQIQGELNTPPLGNVPNVRPYEHNGSRNKGKRKHMKTANMIPPSRPNVTRLSDDSVMLRWTVSKTMLSLPIRFFKVQYRIVGGSAPRNWQTSNEDIPYSYDNSDNGVKNFTSSVSGLLADRFYRFRIIAVYSNNDNKEGNISAKFYLQRGAKANLPAPQLQRVEAVSETALMLYWTLPGSGHKVEGYYAYYRPASSAAQYFKATVDGVNVTSFQIDMLEPGTSYEFKLQSFNTLAASEFSAILQGKTKKHVVTTTPPPVVKLTTKEQENAGSIYPVVAGATGGGILLILATLAACLCMKKRKGATANDEDKPQLDHIQADFVTPSVLGMSTHSGKAGAGHRLNGVLPRMNITPNPLAQEADKNRNVMELRFMPTTTTTTTATATPSSTTTATTNTATAATTTTTTSVTNVSAGSSSSSSSGGCGGGGSGGPSTVGKQQLSLHSQAERLSSSCETLEACESTIGGSVHNMVAAGVAIDDGDSELHAQLAKPLPPLPTKGKATSPSKTNATITSSTITTNNNHSNNNKQSLKSPIVKCTSNAMPIANTNTNTTNAHHNPNANFKQQQQQSTAEQPTAEHAPQPIANDVNFLLPNSSQATTLNNYGNNQSHQQSHHQSATSSPNHHMPQHHHHHHHLHQPGLHHAQPIQPGTPTMLAKRLQATQHSATPPPVPPHQNNNNSNNNNNHHQQHHHLHHHQQQQQQHHMPSYQQAPPASPSPLDHQQQRRAAALASRAFMQYSAGQAPPPSALSTSPTSPSMMTPHNTDNTMNMDGLPTRGAGGMHRTRRSSGSANNNNGGVGIPILTATGGGGGSPCVQRSPMLARAVMKRNRLGSHSANDNISSGSLNSIEV